MAIDGRRFISAFRTAQAMIELAIGMFTLILVVSALAAFTFYIVGSLKAQNSVRSSSVHADNSVEVDEFAAEWFFGGRRTMDVSEKVVMPRREILR
jgi:hypothetical protein